MSAVSPTPDLAMSQPPFAGSLRLQTLAHPSGLRFAEAIDCTPEGVVMLILNTIPRREYLLPAAGLLAPWPKRATVLDRAGLLNTFAATAGEALVATRMPFAVVPDGMGCPTRPPDLWRLTGEPPGGGTSVRLHLGQHAKMIGEHLIKHFGGAGADQWLPLLSSLRDRGMPVRPHHVTKAVTHATRHGGSPAAGPQDWEQFGAAWWPLAEFYTAAVALHACELATTPAVHAARGPNAVGRSTQDLATELLELALNGYIDAGQETVAAASDGLLWVAKGSRGPGHPVNWASAYPNPRAEAKLRAQAVTMARHPAVEVRSNLLVRT